MAALCRARAVTAEGLFLRVFLFSRPCRSTGTESGSGSGSSDSTIPRKGPGCFATALERHLELEQELGRLRVSLGSYARDAAGRAGGCRIWWVEPGVETEPVTGVESGTGAEPGVRRWSWERAGALRMGWARRQGATRCRGRGRGTATWPAGVGGAGSRGYVLFRLLAAWSRSCGLCFPPFVLLLYSVYMLDLRGPHSALVPLEASAGRETNGERCQ